MKRKMISLVLLLSCIISTEAIANEKVIWDGAEIVDGQIGKMTFSKDVKIYKKNSDGSFTSMVVKRNNFFRVYGKEQELYGNTYLMMSGGYRVQKTELVIYKDVPLNVRKQVSGGGYVKEEIVYASSKSGLSIKSAPNNSAETMVRIPFGTTLQVISSSGDFVKVLYDPYFGRDSEVTGYVSKSYISSLPKPSIKYLSESVKVDKQIGRPANGSLLYRKTSVNAYFTTPDGFTYISTGNIFGFVPSNILSTTKVVDIPLSVINDPNLVVLDTTKDISKYYTSQFGTYGSYSVQAPNSWVGSTVYEEGEIYEKKSSNINLKIFKDKIVYSIDTSTLTIPIPLRVGSNVIVDDQVFPVEKMVKSYEPLLYASRGKTIHNVVIAGPLTIGKNFIKYYDDVWYQD